MKRLAIVMVPLLILAFSVATLACASGDEEPTTSPTSSPSPGGRVETMELPLSSLVFQDGDTIPTKYTCQGQDVSPPLAWSEPPSGTRSFALIMDDPDAPGGVFTHWVMFNIPPDARELPEAIPTEAQLSSGALHGKNDFGRIGYGGPCPPPGRPHRYRFTLYALAQSLDLGAGVSKKQVLDAMQGQILAQGQLTGTYQR